MSCLFTPVWGAQPHQGTGTSLGTPRPWCGFWGAAHPPPPSDPILLCVSCVVPPTPKKNQAGPAIFIHPPYLRQERVLPGGPRPRFCPPPRSPWGVGKEGVCWGGGCVCVPPPSLTWKAKRSRALRRIRPQHEAGVLGTPGSSSTPHEAARRIGGGLVGGVHSEDPHPELGGGVGLSPTSPQVFGLDATAQLPAGCHCGDKGGVGGPLS